MIRFLFASLLFFSSNLFALVSGGFIENQSVINERFTLSQSEIQNILPVRGKFTFPYPYNTQGIRLTNANDCNGSDCINYVGYAYWRNMNNHVGQNTMLIFVGMDINKGGAGPSLLSYNKVTDEVLNLGSLFTNMSPHVWSTGEGWYFSATKPYSMYINNQSKLLRYDVALKTFETIFDAASHVGSNTYIWQVHSSNDDNVHSATIRDLSSNEMLGCIVYTENTKAFKYYPKIGDFDECQIDKSGKWLLIKENVDGQAGEDNRIINMQTGHERFLSDQQGAAGHSDMGFEYMIAADNWANYANTQKLWNFNDSVLQGITVYHNTNWNIFSPSHVSHSNAQPKFPSLQYVCGSSVTRGIKAEGNEIICFNLYQSDKVLIVAPVMTNLDALGGGDDYAKSPKGNLDVTGQYFIWTSNMSGSRLDAFLVKIPSHLLTNDTIFNDGFEPVPNDHVPPTISTTTAKKKEQKNKPVLCCFD